LDYTYRNTSSIVSILQKDRSYIDILAGYEPKRFLINTTLSSSHFLQIYLAYKSFYDIIDFKFTLLIKASTTSLSLHLPCLSKLLRLHCLYIKFAYQSFYDSIVFIITLLIKASTTPLSLLLPCLSKLLRLHCLYFYLAYQSF
jgi:hypothetical protein